MRKLLLCLLIGACYADGMQDLDNFLQKKNSAVSADFTQTIYGKKKNRISSGNMQIERPNKFRWQYVEDQQLIVSNGKDIYIYDKPLQQITKKKLGSSLGKSPALLLAGGTDIKKYYNVKTLTDSDGMEWVELTPKNIDDNNGFKLVQLGFKKDNQALGAMKFVDGFDNKSMISFTNVKYGNKFPEGVFNFTPPKGVDVIQSDAN